MANARENGLAVAGLVLGILGVVFARMPGLNAILGVLATVFGVLGWRRGRSGAARGGVGLAGMIMGIIDIVVLFATAYGKETP